MPTLPAHITIERICFIIPTIHLNVLSKMQEVPELLYSIGLYPYTGEFVSIYLLRQPLNNVFPEREEISLWPFVRVFRWFHLLVVFSSLFPY